MKERGDKLLEAHMKSLDPAVLTARERLALAMGERLAQKLLFALERAH